MLAPSRYLTVRWSMARALSEPARSIRDSFPMRVTMLDPSFTLYSSTTYNDNRSFNEKYMLGDLLNEICEGDECLLKNVTNKNSCKIKFQSTITYKMA